MKLTCAVVGAGDGIYVSVDIENKKRVDDLRKRINEKLPSAIQCAACEIQLLLAKRGRTWLKAVDVKGLVDTDLPDFLQMRPLRQIHDFSFPRDVERVGGDIHILAVIPKLSDGEVNAAKTPSTHHPRRLERWVQINEILQQNNPPEQASPDPFSRWSEVGPVFNEDMVTYDETVRAIPESRFDMLSTMLTWIKKCFSCKLIDDDNENNRLHLIAPVLWSIVQDLPDSSIHIDQHLDGSRVGARVHFDFLLVCGTKRVGIIAVKEEMFRHGMAQALVGCEIIADLDNTHEVFTVVTNMEKWIFMKSLDEEIAYDEFNLLTFDKGSVPHPEMLLNIVGKLHSMLSSGLPSVVVSEDSSDSTG